MQQLKHLSDNYKNNEPEEKSFYYGKLKFKPGQLVIVGARPAMGKTTLLLSMLLQFSSQSKEGMLFISNEENENTLFLKLACQASNSEYLKIETQIQRIIRKCKILERDNIFLSQLTESWKEQKEKIIEKLNTHNLHCIFIDKLQGLDFEKNNISNKKQREFIIHELKQLAVDFNVLIIVSSNLKRAVEYREGKIPRLSDLRGTGLIEEISDVVIFINRYEYYGITEDESGNSLIGTADIIVAKNRNGELDNISYKFVKSIPKFEERFQSIPFNKDYYGIS